jgi:hypothetical protein
VVQKGLKHNIKNKLTARERIDLLLNKGKMAHRSLQIDNVVIEGELLMKIE